MNPIGEVNPGNITAVILAGGEGHRMGGADKGLVELGGKPLIAHLIARIQPQASSILISANRNIEHYQAYGYPVIEDQLKNQGPLGGILSALQQCQSDWLLTAPCDTPYIPLDLVSRFTHAASQTPAALYTVNDGHRRQPLFSMIHRSLTGALQQYLATDNQKASLWLTQQNTIEVDFADQSAQFININTAEILKECAKKSD